jgi:hypothetical protein
LDYFPAFINSEKQSMELKQLLVAAQEGGFLSESDRQLYVASIDKNLVWATRNIANIEAFFAGPTPPTAQPTPPTISTTPAPTTKPTDPTTSTTLGSSSLIASLTVVTICALVKLFI